MSGPNIKPSQGIANQQQQVFGQEIGGGQQDKAQMMSLLAPVISFNQGLTSGDPSKVALAASPILNQITQQFGQAKQQLDDSATRGAGTDFAKQMLPIEQANVTSGALGNAVLGGFNNLANIGQGFGQFSLGETGAGLRAGEGAAQTQKDVMQAQAAQKQATMGFLGSLVEAAGGFATGGLSTLLAGKKGGGGWGSPSSEIG